MSTQWLNIQSFQYDQDLLGAINTLSIHTKLELAGIADSEQTKSAELARHKLTGFLQELEEIVSLAEQGKNTPLLGKTPRLRQLVKSFVSAKENSQQFHSILFKETLSYTQQLLDSNHPEDKQKLIDCLQELRVLIEEHIQTDTEHILGDS